MAETLTSTLPDPDYNADLYRDVPVKRLMAWVVDLLLITLLVRVSSPGPALFRQQRHGVGGESIQMWRLDLAAITTDVVKTLIITENHQQIRT